MLQVLQLHRVTTIDTSVQKLSDISRQNADDLNKHGDATFNNATVLSIVISIIAVILSLTVAILLTRSITGPLSKGVKMLKELGLGHLNSRLKMSRRDEIGELADTMDQFADDLQSIVVGTMKKIANGDVSTPVKPKDKGDEIAPAIVQIQQSIRDMVTEADTLVKAAMEGRLAVRADASRYQGEYRKVIQGINDTLDSIVGFIDEMPIPAMVIDNDFSVLYINAVGAQVGGREPNDLLGKKCYDHFKTSDCGTAKCACGRVIQGATQASSETDAHPGNLSLDIAYSAVPVKNREGKVIGAREFVTDQTAIKTEMRLADKVSKFQALRCKKLQDAWLSSQMKIFVL